LDLAVFDVSVSPTGFVCTTVTVEVVGDTLKAICLHYLIIILESDECPEGYRISFVKRLWYLVITVIFIV